MARSADCANCSAPFATQKCGQCRTVTYCGKDCQVAHWRSGHKAECKALAAQAAAAQQQNGAAAAPASKQPPGAASKKKKEEEEDDEVVPVPERVLFDYGRFLRLMRPPLEPGALGVAPPVGLANCGNTCFANALLQCMLGTQPLAAYLGSGDHAATCSRPTNATWCLLCEMQRLAEQVQEAQREGPGAVVAPRGITRHVRQIAPLLTPGRQEDSHELFVGMVEQMEGVMLHQEGGKLAVPDVRSQETTFIGHCFTSYTCLQTECPSCSGISQRYDSKRCLELSINARTPMVEACLAHEFADEQLDQDNLYKCGKCKQSVRATRHSCIEVAPNVLVLEIKRFLGRWAKDNRHVAYGETLDLEPFKAENSIDTTPATYRLYGVLVHVDHMNSAMFGHYVAFVRRPDGRWFLCDDSRVQQVSAHEALAQKAYMLFYLRDVPRPAPDPALRPPQGTKVVSQPRRCKGTPAPAAARKPAAPPSSSHPLNATANGHHHHEPATANGHHYPGRHAGDADANGDVAHDAPRSNGVTFAPDVADGGAAAATVFAHGNGDGDGFAGLASKPGLSVSTGHMLRPSHSHQPATQQQQQQRHAASPRSLGGGGGGGVALPHSPSAPLSASPAHASPRGGAPSLLGSPSLRREASSSCASSALSPPPAALARRAHVHRWAGEPPPHRLHFAGVTVPGSQAALPVPSWRVKAVPAGAADSARTSASGATGHGAAEPEARTSGDGGAAGASGNAPPQPLLQLYVNLPGVASAEAVRLAILGNEVLVWVPGAFLLPLLLPSGSAPSDQAAASAQVPAPVALRCYAPVKYQFRAVPQQLKVLLDVAEQPALFEAGDFTHLTAEELAPRPARSAGGGSGVHSGGGGGPGSPAGGSRSSQGVSGGGASGGGGGAGQQGWAGAHPALAGPAAAAAAALRVEGGRSAAEVRS